MTMNKSTPTGTTMLTGTIMLTGTLCRLRLLRGLLQDHCRCCIPDADVVLHARAGEQRVIPFLLRNPWRREREVTIAVGPWQV